MSFNLQVVVGRVSSAPVKRNSRNGDMVNFQVTSTEKWITASGDEGSRSEKHRVKMFGRLAAAASDLKQGDLVVVSGQTRTDVILKEDGSEGIFTDLVANQFSVIQ